MLNGIILVGQVVYYNHIYEGKRLPQQSDKALAMTSTGSTAGAKAAYSVLLLASGTVVALSGFSGGSGDEASGIARSLLGEEEKVERSSVAASSSPHCLTPARVAHLQSKQRSCGRAICVWHHVCLGGGPHVLL